MRYFETTESQQELVGRVRALGEQWPVTVQRWGAEECAPLREMLDAARDAGPLGITIPKQHGGQTATSSTTTN